MKIKLSRKQHAELVKLDIALPAWPGDDISFISHDLTIPKDKAKAVHAVADEQRWKNLAQLALVALTDTSGSIAVESPALMLEAFKSRLLDPTYFRNGWLFQLRENWRTGESELYPYQVRRVDIYYRHRQRKDGRDERVEAGITIQTAYADLRGNRQDKVFTVLFNAGRTLTQMLEAENLHFESDDLLSDYYSDCELAKDILSKPGAQFIVETSPRASRTGKRNRSFYEDRASRWANVPMKCAVMRRTLEVLAEPAPAMLKPALGARAESLLKLPIYLSIPVLVLEGVREEEHHPIMLVPYEWKTNLFDQLILPSNVKTAIQSLCTVMGEGTGTADFIDGKGEGVAILCRGKPGTGKTLTAEVVTEHHHIPLIKVNATDLGLTAADVEDRMAQILEYADSLGLAVLLDEADVYIRTRDDNMQHVAIVAAMLRIMEYSGGLLFLTTNRFDVDDAIVSRCAAVIDYAAMPADLQLAVLATHAKHLGFGAGVQPSVFNGMLKHISENLLPLDIAPRDVRNLLATTKRLHPDVVNANNINELSARLREAAALRATTLQDAA